MTPRLSITLSQHNKGYLLDGEVFLGHDYSGHQKESGFSMIKELSNIQVTGLSLGRDHMLAVTREGVVWGVGSNQQG